MTRPIVHPLWGSLSIERDGPLSLQEQVVGYFRQAILEQRLPRGQRLPSSRQLAIDHGISRTTAVEAYERLVAEGYLVARPGSGLYVAEQCVEDLVPDRAEAVLPPAPQRPRPPAPISPFDLRTYQLPLAPGMPAIDRFPWHDWRRHLSAVTRDIPIEEIGHGDPMGQRPLREAIAGYLAAAKGIACDPDQLMVIAGTVQLFDVALQILRAPGADIWVEDPSYPFIPAAAERAGFVVHSVPVDAEGIDVGAGTGLAASPVVVLASPSHHVPSGACMSLERRAALVGKVEAGGGWLIENEFDADYRFNSRALPTCFSLSQHQRVILLGSVSKPFAPGLRVGYLLLPPALLERARSMDLPQAPVVTQLALARMSRSGELASHLRQLRVVHAHRRRLLIEALQREAHDLLRFVDAPEAGMRFITYLPDTVVDTAISAECLLAGIKVEALSNCYRRLPRRQGLLIGFGSTPEDRIGSTVAELARILRRHL